MGKKLEIEVTERGFSFIQFKDDYGSMCSLQKSSNAERDCIWLGVDIPFEGCEGFTRMHLTQKQVKALLPYLETFVKTGEINYE